jgi:hypothetical protein
MGILSKLRANRYPCGVPLINHLKYASACCIVAPRISLTVFEARARKRHRHQ